MAVLDDFWSRLNFEMVEFILQDWWDYRDAAVIDGKDFLEKIMAKAARWCLLLENGTYSREDFRWLLAGTKEQADLTELKRRGLPKAELDRFAYGLINIIVHTAFNFFVPEAGFHDSNSQAENRWRRLGRGETKKGE